MVKSKMLMLLSLIVFVLLITFYLAYGSLLDGFKSTAVTKSDLIREHVNVSSNIIDGLAAYGHIYFEQGNGNDPELYDRLRYDAKSDFYHLDSIGGTAEEKTAGNLTGLGPIPVDGIAKTNVSLALQYNKFFSRFYEKFPDITWLYYTSEIGLTNIYPWTASEDFRYTEYLKTVEFYKVANPANDPSRSSVWTPVYLDAAGEGLMVTLSAPVYSKDDFQGVVSLDLTNAWLSKEIKSSYESYLIDDNFTVLASSQENFSKDKIDNLSQYLKLSNDNIEKLATFKEGTVQALGGYYIYTASFDDAPWTLIFLVPVWEIFGKAFLFTLPILIISILLLLALNQIEKRRKSEALLEKKNNLLETTLSSIDSGIIVTDHYGKITLMNKMAEEFTGWESAEAVGQEFQDVFNNINYVTGEKRPDPVKKVLQTGENTYPEKSTGLVSKDGTEVYISGAASAVKTENGTITGAVVSFRDITKEYEQEKQIEGFLELNLDMLCVIDIDGNFHKVNKKFEETFGHKSEELERKKFLSFIHDDDIQLTLESITEFNKNKPVIGFTNRFRCKDGSYKYIEWHTQPRIGKFIYSSARDVTEQVLEKEELETMAGTDHLTGAYNRHYFDSIIKGEMSRADYFGESLSMALIDMDHFKKVNDTWGHPIGDEVLRHTTKTIEAAIRDSDILVRFGGEEFLLLMPKTTLKGALIVSEKIRTAIEEKQHPVAGKQTASIGVAERSKAETFLNWYAKVDKALYEAKGKGRNRVVAAGRNEEKK